MGKTSVVAPGLIEHLKAQVKASGGRGYSDAYAIVINALERAIGALEQIDHNTKLRPHD